ncbi:MAG: right-handed parallel beta-helix repeat-containing protein [Victivallaceae bacterium]|nr:right-handed parallel beta-helix repeat-containing protein [Victivallaceae bacterium]
MKKILCALSWICVLHLLPAVENGVFNVRDFGARGDGKTADSAAIQKAIDVAANVHGTIFFPPGIYLCHGLRVPSHVCLSADPVWGYRGEDAGAVLALDSPDAPALLDVTDSFGVRIRGLLLSGAKSGDGKPVHGILLNNDKKYSKFENSITVEDCKITKFSGHGIYLKRAWLFVIRRNLLMSNGGCGMRVHGCDGFVSDNQFSSNGGDGFSYEMGCSTVMFTANRVEWNHGHGLNICEGDTWNITGNSFDRNWGAAIRAEKINTSAITGNTFRRCGSDCSKLPDNSESAGLILLHSQGLTVTGNAFVAGHDDGGTGNDTPDVGMIVEDLTDSVISGNVLHRGYMKKPLVDRGGHGQGVVMKDNPGSAME